jgi:hypothetical protein
MHSAPSAPIHAAPSAPMNVYHPSAPMNVYRPFGGAAAPSAPNAPGHGYAGGNVHQAVPVPGYTSHPPGAYGTRPGYGAYGHPGYGYAGGAYGRGYAHPSYNAWRGGHWYHGYHGSTLGWWWIVGPAWYAFSSPIYPYPDYSFDTDVSPDLSSGYWYWCAPLQAYYPYVQTCPVPWQQVIPAG